MLRKLVIALFLFMALRAEAAEPVLPYTFETFDITFLDRVFFPVDINDKGRILTNVVYKHLTRINTLVTGRLNRRGTKFRDPVIFSCANIPFTDTEGEKLTNQLIVGTCETENQPTPFGRLAFVKALNAP